LDKHDTKQFNKWQENAKIQLTKTSNISSLRSQLVLIRNTWKVHQGEEKSKSLQKYVLSAEKQVLNAERKAVAGLKKTLLDIEPASSKIKPVIKNAEEIKLGKPFQPLMDSAKELVKELDQIAHVNNLLLNLNQRTIAEIKSFNTPLPDIEKVMRITLILLGEEEEDVKTWKEIVACMGRTGKNSLKRRIGLFNPKAVEAKKMDYAAKQIGKVNGHKIQQTSEGAAVFYEWILQVVKNSLRMLMQNARRAADVAPTPDVKLWATVDT
jgi:hypothetical protein